MVAPLCCGQTRLAGQTPEGEGPEGGRLAYILYIYLPHTCNMEPESFLKRDD